jgi:hypothetical protein
MATPRTASWLFALPVSIGRRRILSLFIPIAAGLWPVSVSAAFVGFVTEMTVVAPGKTATKVYAKFTNPSDTLLSAFQIHAVGTYGGATGLGTGNFWHKDFLNGNVQSAFAGTWNPTLLLSGNANLDSWVTIGGSAADFSNTTTSDPGWGGAAFNQPGIPDTAEAGVAGWSNGNPPNLQGRPIWFGGTDYRVLVGNFVTTEGSGIFLTMSVRYNQGIGTPDQFAVSCAGIPFYYPQDFDGDGLENCIDNCEFAANPTQADCDEDGVGDACDADPDSDSDGITDTCECPGDLNQSGTVDAEDLAYILFAWGTYGGKTPEADITRDGTVDANDLSVVLGSWGPCP